MFGFKVKKEYINLIDTARENYNSYPKRLLKHIVNNLDDKIKKDSYEGCRGTYLNITGDTELCIDELKQHYESQGFEVEIEKKTMWIWWSE